MRTFLNHIKKMNTLDEINTSLKNFWQQMVQLSEFFQYSFMLILKRKCLVGASRVRCRESGTLSTIIYTRWSSQRYELGCDAPVAQSFSPVMGTVFGLSTRSRTRQNFWSAKSRVRLAGVTENAGQTCRKLSGIKWFFASRE